MNALGAGRVVYCFCRWNRNAQTGAKLFFMARGLLPVSIPHEPGLSLNNGVTQSWSPNKQTNKQVHKCVHFEVSRLLSSKLQSLLERAVQAPLILGSSHTPTSSFSRVSGLARTKENGFLPYILSGLGSLKQPAAMAGHWQGTVSRRSGASIPAAPLL